MWMLLIPFAQRFCGPVWRSHCLGKAFNACGFSSVSEHVFESQGSKDFVVQKIWQRIVDDNFQSLTVDFADGIRRVLSERYLYMGYGLSMRYSYGHDCRIYTLPTTYFQTQISFMMKKNSPLIPILNKM